MRSYRSSFWEFNLLYSGTPKQHQMQWLAGTTNASALLPANGLFLDNNAYSKDRGKFLPINQMLIEKLVDIQA